MDAVGEEVRVTEQTGDEATTPETTDQQSRARAELSLSELTQDLREWMAAAPNWMKSRAFLLAHQTLWTDVAAFLLEHLAAGAETEREARSFETHRRVLRALRLRGVDDAFEVVDRNDGDIQEVLETTLDAEERRRLCALLMAADAREPALNTVTRMSILLDCANALQELAERRSGSTSRDLLAEAVSRYAAALALCDRATQPLQWAMIQSNRGAALRSLGALERGERRPSAYAAAIRCYDAALEVCSFDIAPREWAGIQVNKGVALESLAEITRGEERAEYAQAALSCFEAIIERHPHEVTADEWAALHNNEGMALRVLAGMCDGVTQRSLLEKALVCFDAALDLYLQSHRWSEVATTQTNRAATLDALAALLAGEDRRRAYSDAIAGYDAALAACSRDVAPRDWAMIQNDKGTTIQALASLMSGEGQQRLLKEALTCFGAALEEYTRDAAPLHWATVQNNKGEAHRQLADALVTDEERMDALAEALLCFDAALEEYTRDQLPMHWAGAQNNKGAALCSLGALLGGRAARQTFTEALTCYDAALLDFRREVAPLDWAMVQNNQANALLELARLPFSRDERRHACETAIAHYTAALEVRRLEVTPLAWAETNNNKGNALMELAGMLDADARAQALQAAVLCHQAAYDASPLAVVPQRHRSAAAALARARITLGLERREDLPQELDLAWKVTQTGLEATTMLERFAPARSFREIEWAESATLFSLAAAILTLRGDPTAAVAFVEAGRTRGLNEEYARRHAQLGDLTDDERHEYDVAAQEALEIEAMGRGLSTQDFAQFVAEARARSERLTTVIAMLQTRHPGFMQEQPWSIDLLVASLHPDEALVYLIPYSFGSLALAVFPDRPLHAEWLHELTTVKLFTLATQPDADGYNQVGYLPAAVGRGVTAMADALDSLLPALGEHIMRHVVRVARGASRRRVTLAPGGIFAVLPLHAATYLPLSTQEPVTAPAGRRYACDDLTLTYAPSGRVLIQARTHAARLAAPTRACVVANPHLVSGSSDDWRPGAPGYLLFAEAEARAVVEAMIGAGIPRDAITFKQGEDATRAAVLEGLRSADIVHLAMHGSFDSAQPLSSGLRVAPGELLTMQDLMDQRLLSSASLRLVTLSACQTGLSDFRRLREEAFGLYGALLSVGAAGVIASMWPVDDAATASLMDAFIRAYFTNDYDGGSALALAMQSMRSAPGSQQAAGAATPDTPSSADASHLRHLAPAAQPRQSPGESPLVHPSHWAAFGYYGA